MGNLLNNIKASSGSSNSAWVDEVVHAVQTQVSNIQQPEFKQAVIAATVTLVAHKEDIAALGLYGLTLFLQKVAIGDTENAYITFIETQASFQDLIEGENTDAIAIITNKDKREQMKAKALSIITDLTLNGIRILLPFLLTLI